MEISKTEDRIAKVILVAAGACIVWANEANWNRIVVNRGKEADAGIREGAADIALAHEKFNSVVRSVGAKKTDLQSLTNRAEYQRFLAATKEVRILSEQLSEGITK